MTEEYRYIGKRSPRKDARDIVTGAVKYLNDLRFPDLLYGRVLRSSIPHGRIKKINKEKAEKLSGVMAVLTWTDVPDWKTGNPKETRILDQKVRFMGDAVALIAAKNEEIAEEALSLIDVEYEVLPPVFDMEESLRPSAPKLYDELPNNILPSTDPSFGSKCLGEISMGDVEKGFTEADVIVEGTSGYENIPNPIPAEPPSVVAQWDESGRQITFWVSNQFPHLNRLILRSIIRDNIEIRTIGNPCGGSFGTKLMSWQIQCYAALLSMATSRPVKIVYSKEEHIAAFVLRPGSRMRAKIGMKKDGTVTAISGDWYIDTGYYSKTTQMQLAVGCGEAQIAVRCENWDLKPKIVCTNRNASGIVRGFGGQELKCSLFPILSLALAKLNMDPLDFFIKNFIKPGEGYYWRDGEYYTYRGVDFTRAIEAGAEKFGWQEKWKGWLKPSVEKGNIRRGVGMGIHGNADVGEDVSEAYVRLHPNASVILFSGVSEHGTGQVTNLMKMIAEVLKISPDRISMAPTDSLTNPNEFGFAGSRGTYAVGSAVINAAEDARKKLLDQLALGLKANPDDLDTEDGFVFAKGNPDKKIPWSEMGYDRTITGFGVFEPDFTLVNCVINFVEVEVDLETGKTTLIRVVTATDVGKIIDPPGLEAQLSGCLGSGGIDSAIFEETILDHSTGYILNANLIDYKWRTSLELPIIDHAILETPIDSHRFYAVGVGEITTSPGPSAVQMAVSNAIGKWFSEYPVTPERLLKIIGRQDKSEEGQS